VGDQVTLAPFPFFITARDWTELAALARDLSTETLAAERELLRESRLHRDLGLPPGLLALFAQSHAVRETPSFSRTLRFDFHPTRDGWRVSEVNSDVPGGFSEAESFTALMAEHYSGSRVPGAPGSRWAECAATSLGSSGLVALLSAPGHMEDFQVTAYLAQRLEQHGLTTLLLNPTQLGWRDGRAFVARTNAPLTGLVRFYQAEWLARLPKDTGWQRLFFDGETRVSNAAGSALTESKRFPLSWTHLSTRLPTFSRLLPETRALSEAPWFRDDGWLLKAAYSNAGDSVVARPWVNKARWARTAAQALARPRSWVAQRRFEIERVDTPEGALAPCVGVYVIDGEVAGAYLRLSKGRLIDYSAMDAALLITDEA